LIRKTLATVTVQILKGASVDDLEKIVRMASEAFDVSREKIVPQMSFTRDLGADSVDLVEFVMQIEEAFMIHIPDDALIKLKTIEDLSQYVIKLKSVNGAKDDSKSNSQESL